MPRTIGGQLDTRALSRMRFHSLDAQEQANAIRRMAYAGKGEHAIADATGLSVVFIRRVIGGQPRHAGGGA